MTAAAKTTAEPRAWSQKATNEEVIAAYQATGSVWRAAKQLGMVGQSVHERLRALNYPLAGRKWTVDEDAELATLVANGVPLGEIAHRLGRPYSGVAGRASHLGIKSIPKRNRKIPRGAGYDKASVEKHLRNLERSGVKVTRYARAEGLSVELLAKAIERNFPDRWQAYKQTHSDIPSKTCVYCETEFIPGNSKQTYCTRDCATAARSDRSYFGGNRRATIGLAEGVCQLCGRKEVKGLSSHHILGKENDPLNTELVALCPGCHQVVSHLGGRAFVDDPRAWEALIALAWTRRHGHEIHANPQSQVVYTEVHIEVYDADLDEDFGEAMP